VSLREPIDRSKDDELFDVIREWGEARAKKARLREEEDETLATLGALDEIYAPHVEAKHARVGVNVAGKVSEITAQDKEDFAKLLKYSSEWRLSIPDLGWPVAPQIVAAFLLVNMERAPTSSGQVQIWAGVMAQFFGKQPSSRIGVTSSLAVSSTVASTATAAFGAQTYQISVAATVTTFIAVGDGTPTATTSSAVDV
jgi:hypothetical protein